MGCQILLLGQHLYCFQTAKEISYLGAIENKGSQDSEVIFYKIWAYVYVW